ncbi:MAG: arsenate reductase ArsC [Candidatus Lokiarchaeota archaeon]|nr:arsenate reductase ArsC [Candidatus Lokiarchaeota archaeon]
MKKTNIIFLCTHNQARSQMAEAFTRKYAEDQFNVYSAGFEPKEIHPMTKKVMEEVGISLENHTSKRLKNFLGKVHFGIVITVCEKAEELCPTIPGVSTRLYWPIGDPAAFEGSDEERLEKFRDARDAIDEKIKDWLKERNKT